MPYFLSERVVLNIHREQVNIFGGLHGVREPDLLASAIGQAEQTYVYTGNLFQAAAAYGVSLARNHAFLDGNKRTAADCMLTFLLLNQRRPLLSNGQLFEWMLRVAIGEMDRDTLAALLETHTSEGA